MVLGVKTAGAAALSVYVLRSGMAERLCMVGLADSANRD
jgi:hypothetical protein